MESAIEAGDRGIDGDEMFHKAITTAAHSTLIAKLMHEISSLIRENRIESLSQKDRPRASLAAHRRIADAVRKQDPQQASRAMADHIRLVSDVALLRETD
jgi:GntR family transcriptional repressor for pyruvate dehydrogenase complex